MLNVRVLFVKCSLYFLWQFLHLISFDFSKLVLSWFSILFDFSKWVLSWFSVLFSTESIVFCTFLKPFPFYYFSHHFLFALRITIRFLLAFDAGSLQGNIWDFTISVSPPGCFILVLILISVLLRYYTQLSVWWTKAKPRARVGRP